MESQKSLASSLSASLPSAGPSAAGGLLLQVSSWTPTNSLPQQLVQKGQLLYWEQSDGCHLAARPMVIPTTWSCLPASFAGKPFHRNKARQVARTCCTDNCHCPHSLWRAGPHGPRRRSPDSSCPAAGHQVSVHSCASLSVFRDMSSAPDVAGSRRQVIPQQRLGAAQAGLLLQLLQQAHTAVPCCSGIPLLVVPSILRP